MSRLMSLLGIILAAAGLLLIVLSVVDPGLMQVYGVTPEAGAILLVGGVLALGLGGVITAIEGNGVGSAMPAGVKVEKLVPTPDVKASATKDLSRKGPEAPSPAAAPSSAKSTLPSVAETISALEQAKSDIKTALGGMDDVVQVPGEAAPVPLASQPAAPQAAAEPAQDEDVEGELYVVEEKIIRGRPSRILSDDTVEAETDEGWMRFENLEHLNEYLDSVEEGQA